MFLDLQVFTKHDHKYLSTFKVPYLKAKSLKTFILTEINIYG